MTISAPSAGGSHDPARAVLEGAPNFRDLGGLPTADGRRVRTGRLFRSGVLDALTDADLAALGALRIATVVDLRSGDEVAQRPNRLPPGARSLHLPVTDVSAAPAEILDRLERGDVAGLGAEMLLAGNEAFVRRFRDAFAEVVAILMEPSHHPAVFHCTAGKDRTGVIASALFGVLGLSAETIVEDYAASAVGLPDMMAYYRNLRPDAPFDAERAERHLRRAATAETMAGVVDHVEQVAGSIREWARAAGLASATMDRLSDRLRLDGDPRT